VTGGGRSTTKQTRHASGGEQKGHGTGCTKAEGHSWPDTLKDTDTRLDTDTHTFPVRHTRTRSFMGAHTHTQHTHTHTQTHKHSQPHTHASSTPPRNTHSTPSRKTVTHTSCEHTDLQRIMSPMPRSVPVPPPCARPACFVTDSGGSLRVDGAALGPAVTLATLAPRAAPVSGVKNTSDWPPCVPLVSGDTEPAGAGRGVAVPAAHAPPEVPPLP
jgi:hypothetical protein